MINQWRYDFQMINHLKGFEKVPEIDLITLVQGSQPPGRGPLPAPKLPTRWLVTGY